MKTILQKIGMLVAVLCTTLSAYAYDFEVDGIYYSVISLDDMTCEVTKGDHQYEGDIVIPGVVTYNKREFSVISISRAFRSNTIVKSVIIPNTITSIEKETFMYCSSLEYVEIPNSVTAIDDDAFYGCTALKTIAIPASVKSIGSNAFHDCYSLKSITIPNSVTSIGNYAFFQCDNLDSVELPNSVISIGYSVFEGCWSLKSIVIPSSLTTISDYTFSNCHSLESVEIPNSVTTIGCNAFGGCSSLNSIVIPNSVTTIGSQSFVNCYSLISIELSDKLEAISYGLFSGCSSLQSLEIPGSVINISQNFHNYSKDEYNTFSKCSDLMRLKLLSSHTPLQVGKIQNYHQFYSGSWEDWTESIRELYIDRELEEFIPVPNLDKLELGESIQTVQVLDINKLEKLTTIESYAVVPPELPEMSNAQYINVNVFVPEEALEAYKADPVWGNFWNITKVEDVKTDSKREVIGRYDMNGRKVSEDYQGLVIVRFSDGSCKKMLNR